MELCKHVETKFVPSGAILFRPGQVSKAYYLHEVYQYYVMHLLDYLYLLDFSVSWVISFSLSSMTVYMWFKMES